MGTIEMRGKEELFGASERQEIVCGHGKGRLPLFSESICSISPGEKWEFELNIYHEGWWYKDSVLCVTAFCPGTLSTCPWPLLSTYSTTYPKYYSFPITTSQALLYLTFWKHSFQYFKREITFAYTVNADLFFFFFLRFTVIKCRHLSVSNLRCLASQKDSQWELPLPLDPGTHFKH